MVCPFSIVLNKTSNYCIKKTTLREGKRRVATQYHMIGMMNVIVRPGCETVFRLVRLSFIRLTPRADPDIQQMLNMLGYLFQEVGGLNRSSSTHSS